MRDEDGHIKWWDFLKFVAPFVLTGAMALSGALLGAERSQSALNNKVDVLIAEVRGNVAVINAHLNTVDTRTATIEQRQYQSSGERKSADAAQAERLTRERRPDLWSRHGE